MAQLQKHLISVLMENEAGSLSRVVGLFSQRGYNIDTLNVAATEDPTLSRLTLTTITTADKIEQIPNNCINSLKWSKSKTYRRSLVAVRLSENSCLSKCERQGRIVKKSIARRTYSVPKSWTYRQIFIPFLSQGMQAS